LQVRFFLLDLDLDLDLDLPFLKRTWTRTWTCLFKVDLDLDLDLRIRDLDLDLDLAVAGLVTSLVHLSNLFNLMLKHSYVPSQFYCSVGQRQEWRCL